MKAIRISEHVWWVGAIDWALREFHGYTTHRGTTYNAYLVVGEKITLIDTVKAPFMEEMLARITDVIGDVTKIDIIVSNHAEMDHSGSLPAVIRAVEPEKVFASELGVKALDAHFRIGDRLTAVKSGESVHLGDLTLQFVETRMLHWPDSMFSFLPEDGVLFSQDGFGMHLATDRLFADENDGAVMLEEMERYYANILLPYAPQAIKLLEVFPTLNLNVKYIAPDHGPVWRDDLLGRPLELYAKWAAQKPSDLALVVYDTMWHSTEKMAFEIADGIRSSGARVRVLSLESRTRSDVAAALLQAGALVVGSPTINNSMYPRVADLMTYLKGLRPQNRLAAAFGSFGWSGEAVKDINAFFEQMKLDLVSEGLKVKYVPSEADFQACFAFGEEIGKRLLSFSQAKQ